MKLCKLFFCALEYNSLVGIGCFLPCLFLNTFLFEAIQTFKHIWLDKDGLHSHLQLSASFNLIYVAEVFNCLRVELSETLEEGLGALVLQFVNFFFQLKHAFVEVDWQSELS